MTLLMGIMAVIMVVTIIAGHRHMMGGHEKPQQKQDSISHDEEKEHFCDDCPAGLELKSKTEVKEEESDKNKTDAEVTR